MPTDSNKPRPAPTPTQLATAPTVLLSPAAAPRRPLAPRSRLQRLLAPDHIREIGATLLIVLPLTLLIWIWAEREQQVRDRVVTVKLLVEPPADRTARLITPASGEITLTLMGPNAGVDQFERRLKATAGSTMTITAPAIDAADGAKQVPVPLRDRLADDRELRAAGLSIQTVSPSEVTIEIDQVDTRAIEIRLPPEYAHLQASIDPLVVSVRGPRMALGRLGPDDLIIADVAAKLGQRAPRSAGEKVTLLDVPLRLPAFASTELTLLQPTAAQVTLTVPQAVERTEAITYNIPISVEMEIVLQADRARAGKPPVVATALGLQGVSVRGPTDIVERLNQPEVKRQIRARVWLTRDDLIVLDDGRPLPPRVPEIVLPEGLRIEGTIPTVTLSLSTPGTSDAQ